MKSLRQKLVELKRHRETIKRDDDVERRAMVNLEDEIKTLESSLGKKKHLIEEAEAKLGRYDVVLGHSQEALEKLANNTKKLENVIEKELTTLKL